MTDTVNCLNTNPYLADAVKYSIRHQYMVAEEESIELASFADSKTQYIVSGKRSFEAAKGYAGKKIAVLNFANNHSVGGAPFSAGAQEESLCRCSTLYPCLKAMEVPFYQKHANDFMAGRLTIMGNDDLIYTPDVIVFKTDERTDPIMPEIMQSDDWYKVNVITCAAPEFRHKPTSFPAGYKELITKRIERILDVAAKEKNEVLILGAWGCGAFGNSLQIVAKAFMELLPTYGFEIVEFAMSSGDGTNTPFNTEIERLYSSKRTENEVKSLATTNNEERFCNILKDTGRPGIDNVLKQLRQGGFFTAPGSVRKHSNWEGGLVEHSLKVYDYAVKLRDDLLVNCPGADVPEDSIAIAALLHDVCKYDAYTIDGNGKPIDKIPAYPLNGHGAKSVILLQWWGLTLLPEEILAICWHMGSVGVNPRSSRETKLHDEALKHDLVRIIVKADYCATH